MRAGKKKDLLLTDVLKFRGVRARGEKDADLPICAVDLLGCPCARGKRGKHAEKRGRGREDKGQGGRGEGRVRGKTAGAFSCGGIGREERTGMNAAGKKARERRNAPAP